MESFIENSSCHPPKELNWKAGNWWGFSDGDRKEWLNLPSEQGTTGKRKVPEQGREKPGSPHTTRHAAEEPNSGKLLSFIMSFPRQRLVISVHLEIGKHTLPNFSFVARLKNSKPILFLQMFKLSYFHCNSSLGLSRIKVIPAGHDTGYPAIDPLDFVVDKAKGKEAT